MTSRPTIEVSTPAGGWHAPWPNVAELADVFPSTNWTLIGGLMVQLHAVHHRLAVVRPTNDVDIVLHIESKRGVPTKAADSLESLGYRLAPSVDLRSNTAHRFTRGEARVDLVSSVTDSVDVLMADHAAPRVEERLRGRSMVRVEGGTQALRRTVNARVNIISGNVTILSVPDPFGALILKAAAYQTDTRDRERHLHDAAVLLCCIEDPYSDRERFAGSDRARLAVVERALPDEHPAWRQIPSAARKDGQAALRLLCTPPPT